MRIICLPYDQIYFLLTPYPTPSYPELLNVCIFLCVLVDLTYSISSLAPYPDIFISFCLCALACGLYFHCSPGRAGGALFITVLDANYLHPHLDYSVV